MTEQPDTTIVVVPRERFSAAKRSLESIYKNTAHPFSLVYVDGNSPFYLKKYLAHEAEKRGFKLIRTDGYLSPNKARNLGFREVKSKYVVFIDNDVIVTPGWLASLVRCAEETGAWIVGPLYLQGELEEQKIHMIGGDFVFEQQDSEARPFLHDKMHFFGKRLTDIPVKPQRTETDFVEFHCMLLHRRVFDQIGWLDESLFSSREHLDVCLAVREAGGKVYVEPESVVSYISPPPVALTDIAFLSLRWSEIWNKTSLDHFENKWQVRINKSMNNQRRHRQVFLSPFIKAAGRLFGRRRARKIEQRILSPVERKLNSFIYRAAK